MAKKIKKAKLKTEAKKPLVKKTEAGTGEGIAGFILGILSIIFAGWFGLVLGVIGLVLAFMQRKKLKTKLSTAALVLNIIGIVLSILVVVFLAKLLEEYLERQYAGLQ